MAKQTKRSKTSKGNNAKQVNAASIATPAVIATPAAPVVMAPVANQTNLTKRNQTSLNAVLVATQKPNRSRAAHVTAAWAAVQAALPATAVQLAALPALQHPQCVSPTAFLSYMQRRGFLVVKA